MFWNTKEKRFIMTEKKQACRQAGMIETLASLVKDKLLSITETAKRADMTQAEFAKAAGL